RWSVQQLRVSVRRGPLATRLVGSDGQSAAAPGAGLPGTEPGHGGPRHDRRPQPADLAGADLALALRAPFAGESIDARPGLSRSFSCRSEARVRPSFSRE